MKIYDISTLAGMDFNIKYLNVLQQFWKGKKEFQCIGAPKKQDLFLFFQGCKAIYTDKDQNVFHAKGGDMVYTPKGSEYKVILYDFENETSQTQGINFLLFNQFGEEITLSDTIKVFHPAPRKTVKTVQKLLDEEGTISYLKKRAYLLDIINHLDDPSSKIDEIIFPGFSYMSEHFDELTPISELARMCNVSEVYFRKRFKECLGTSPVEYRKRLRLEKAKDYLEYGDISVQEISDLLGYATVSHFIKEFKKAYETSPLNYRKDTQFFNIK